MIFLIASLRRNKARQKERRGNKTNRNESVCGCVGACARTRPTSYINVRDRYSSSRTPEKKTLPSMYVV